MRLGQTLKNKRVVFPSGEHRIISPAVAALILCSWSSEFAKSLPSVRNCFQIKLRVLCVLCVLGLPTLPNGTSIGNALLCLKLTIRIGLSLPNGDKPPASQYFCSQAFDSYVMWPCRLTLSYTSERFRIHVCTGGKSSHHS